MFNKLPTITYIYNRYKKATSLKPATIEMRITYEKKQKYISTGITILPRYWKAGKVVNCPDAMHINTLLDKLLLNVRQIIITMANEGEIDIFSIPERMSQMTHKGLTFISFCEKRLSIKRYGKAIDSQKRYVRFLRFFKEWGKIVRFKDVTEENIIAYDQYLSSMKPKSKWNNYHRFLNSFIMDAIDEGYLKRNPYKWINIDRGSDCTCSGRYLTPEEFHRIRTVRLHSECLERVRDTFIFQTYTCLSYTDLRAFKYKNIQDLKGMKVYVGNRNKTGVSFTIPLLQPALDILYKYNNVLPIISNEKYNDYLKLVALAAGVDKPISSHWARHTGATMLLNDGVDMKIVSKICGHSTIKVTERVYAKLLDETVVNAVSKVHI